MEFEFDDERKHRISLGSSKNCEISLENDELIQELHATICRLNKELYICDN